MPGFGIENYKVSSYLERFPGETRPTRLLDMAGPVLFHGIQNHAFFSFSSFFDGVWTAPVAGYLTDSGFSGRSVVGWFPIGEFSYYYDILRNERPVQVLYEFSNAGETSGYLSKVGLGTSTEPIGEGPSDSTEQISAALLQHLTPIQIVVPLPTARDLPKKE